MNDVTDKRKKQATIQKRFDGFLPVVVDVETGGGNAITDALLEIAAVVIGLDEGNFILQENFACHIEPFEGANLDPKSLEINKIDPYHPFRFAIPEKKALEELFEFVDKALKKYHCRRAILVGHNAHFDLSFIKAACKRVKIKDNPFHSFTVFDTATLGALLYGKTVLAKILKAAKIPFNKAEAHSAIYDTRVTAELFCQILNEKDKKKAATLQV